MKGPERAIHPAGPLYCESLTVSDRTLVVTVIVRLRGREANSPKSSQRRNTVCG